jgi:hypothetical protein
VLSNELERLGSLWYPYSMGIDLVQIPSAKTVDLTGLPEPVIREVHRIVQLARQDKNKQAEASPAKPLPRFISDPRPSPEDFERLLDKMASMSTGRILPRDFSRADIYDDHD